MKPADVFLLTTNFDYESLIEPIGISLLSAIIQKSGFTTKVLEPSIRALSWEQCADIIIDNKPKILAISILIDLNVKSVLNLIRKVKTIHKDIIIIVGGQAVTMNYKQEIYDELFDEIDLFMIGESEKIISQLIDHLINKKNWKNILGIGYKNDDRLVVNPPAQRIEDLNEIPFMDRSVLKEILIDHPTYRETSIPYGRGCKHRCTFCSEVFFHSKEGQNRLRRRTLYNVYKEIEFLFFELGMRSFTIEDESFLDIGKDGKREIISFCDNIKKLPEKISLRILGRIDDVEEDTCKALLEAGLSYLYLGVDSIVDDDLRLFNKGYTADNVNNKMDLLIKTGYSLDVNGEHRVSTGYITWHPYTTLKGLRESIEFFKKYNNTPKLIEHKLLLFSSTPLKQKISEDGLLVSKTLQANEFDYKWKFKDPLIDSLYRNMLEYFIEWSPLRDGIRTLEKYITMEKPNLRDSITGLVEVRKNLDKHFYDFFDNLLIEAETGMGNFKKITDIYINELRDIFTDENMKKIDLFCKENGFQSNIVDGIREKTLWLCRYRN